eukprot:CAMPEP_0172160348 /NCGR_PEP_ID=MMETSP1050-20130122/5510_1 /TAXON_ID=233186 /ORGANISM="Cryptomonas curvata, Strain CCAP979/52" /LENGTH=173 /DNA_ID=CAMNT_0012830105 /DNA_START=247 /DNA_END=768 /DNA_ORIENTATION=-
MIAEYDSATFPGEINKKFDQYGLQGFLSANTDIVYLGDVFMKGYEPPDFVGTVLVMDKNQHKCPSGTGIMGMPCFARPDSPDVDPTKHFTGYLVITPQLNGFQVVWSSQITQCVTQTAVGVPALCNSDFKAEGLCSQPETGFQQKQIPISFQKPTCPNDYYVIRERERENDSD